MQATNINRKLDSAGRIMIPSKLREEMGLVSGEEYFFFTHIENGKRYICIECPETSQAEIQKAISLLEQNGMKVSS